MRAISWRESEVEAAVSKCVVYVIGDSGGSGEEQRPIALWREAVLSERVVPPPLTFLGLDGGSISYDLQFGEVKFLMSTH